MRWLRQLLDSKAPLFEEGGKLEKFYPLYEAADTFFYTPGETTKGASHVRDALDLKRMMTMVVVALIPCVFMACYNTGFQANQGYEIALNKIANIAPVINAVVLQENDSENDETEATTDIFEAKRTENGRDTKLNELNQSLGWRGAIVGTPNSTSLISNLLHGATYFLPVYIVCMTIGGICEVIFAMVRGHEVNEGFLVTGLLFPLTLPPTIPLWQVAVGIAFGVVIGKEVFGGTGRNFLNPALTGRAFLYFAYPKQISGNGVWTAVDGYTGATPLAKIAETPAPEAGGAVTTSEIVGQIGEPGSSTTWWDCFIGNMQGSLGETSTLCCLIGAAILIFAKIGSWRIMSGVVIGMTLFSSLLYLISSDPVMRISPLWHLVIGGFAFGTVFMATDPVSASMTRTGKWIYGGLIGFMTVLVRSVNPAFPEGIMLAILFANVFAPLIDYFVVQANIKRRVARYATR